MGKKPTGESQETSYKTLQEKLFDIQCMNLQAKKDATNPFHKSKYMSLYGIMKVLKPILIEQKILLVHYTEEREVVTKLINIDKQEEVFYSSFPLVDTDNPQKHGSCITYAKRYNLMQIFDISEGDDDGNIASGKSVESNVEEKKTFTKDNLDKLSLVKSKYNSGGEAIDEIQKHYSISSQMIYNVYSLYRGKSKEEQETSIDKDIDSILK